MKRFPQPICVDIEAISPFGQGVAKLPLPSGAKALLEVPYTMPGDSIEVAVTGKKNSIYRGHLLNIVKPSQNRIKPLCAHFGACGGCSWQHIPYEEQLQIKQQLLERVFKRELKIEVPLLKIIPCASPFEYRNKMEFSVKEGVLGLIEGGETDKIVPINRCHLMSPWVSSLFDLFKVQGIERVIFREGFEQKLVVVLGKSPFSLTKRLSDEPITFFENETCLLGSPDFEMRLFVKGRTFRFILHPFSFFQPNTRQAEILFDFAIELLSLKGNEVVYDLYCGVGTIGICIAPFVSQVIGIEIFEKAALNAQKNGELNGLKNYRAINAPVNRGLKGLKKADVIVIDPPRAGIDAEALKLIIQAKPKKILYISCHPATLARDLKVFLENGYTIEKIQPVDQFPQTVHIETIVLLVN